MAAALEGLQTSARAPMIYVGPRSADLAARNIAPRLRATVLEAACSSCDAPTSVLQTSFDVATAAAASAGRPLLIRCARCATSARPAP